MEKSTFQSSRVGVILLILIDFVCSKWSSTSENSEKDLFSACRWGGGGSVLNKGKNDFFVCNWGPMSLGKNR